jgi:hypothetical protein
VLTGDPSTSEEPAPVKLEAGCFFEGG